MSSPLPRTALNAGNPSVPNGGWYYLEVDSQPLMYVPVAGVGYNVLVDGELVATLWFTADAQPFSAHVDGMYEAQRFGTEVEARRFIWRAFHCPK